MPIFLEGLEKEMVHITKPFEEKHIRSLCEDSDPLMQEISYALITGNNQEVEEEKAQKRFNMLVKQGIGKFIRRPLKNKRGLSWIRKKKILKKGK